MNNTNQTQTKSRDELGALWKKKSKTGVSFLSGYVKVDDLGLEKEIKVVVFANNKKSNDKAPDYRIYISKPLDAKNSNISKTLKPVESKKQVVEQSLEEDEDIL